MNRFLYLWIAGIVLAGCVSLDVEPVAQSHPAHPDAEVGEIPGLPGALSNDVGRESSVYDSHAVHPQASEYVCPMHPEERASHPNDCSICGMALVPVEESS